MRVLIISHAYVERDNHKKLESLALVPGFEIGVVYPRVWRTWHGEDKLPDAGVAGRSTYREFPLGVLFAGNAGRYVFNLYELSKVLITFRPDLVHLEEEPFVPVAFEVVVLSWLLRLKLIFFSWENLCLPLGLVRSITEKLVFNGARGALVGSSGALGRLRRCGFKKDIHLIPQFGVDQNLFRNFDRRYAKGSGFVVGFVGRFSLDKGIDILFRSVSRLPVDVRLLLVTSSTVVPNSVWGLARANDLSERIRMETGIAHSRLPEFYNLMDVFVLPSRGTKTWMEQFGRTIIEAMACGAPVIGSDSGAIPEVIGTAGLIFREGSSDDLLARLTEVIQSDALRRRLSAAGQELVREKYTFDDLARRTVDYYLSL